jgi:hypothetical protein
MSASIKCHIKCFKYLLELSQFADSELLEVEEVVQELVNKIDASLKSAGGPVEKLESSNFRSLLLEMLEKDVLKKFNYINNFDGIEDEITRDNICYIFVSYSFFQNILLEDKNYHKRM